MSTAQTRDALREALAHLSDAEYRAFMAGAIKMRELIAAKIYDLHKDKLIIYMKEPLNSAVHYRGVKPERFASSIRHIDISGVIPKLREPKK